MVVVASYSKVCVFSENDPSIRRYYYNNIVFKAFHFGGRFQTVIVFYRFRADARWKHKEKFVVSMKTVWKRILVDRALVSKIWLAVLFCMIEKCYSELDLITFLTLFLVTAAMDATFKLLLHFSWKSLKLGILEGWSCSTSRKLYGTVALFCSLLIIESMEWNSEDHIHPVSANWFRPLQFHLSSQMDDSLTAWTHVNISTENLNVLCYPNSG